MDLPRVKSVLCGLFLSNCLLQLRNALTIASVLGRTLVLPDLWCGEDLCCPPNNKKKPGSALLLPFRCPADHVLDLGRWRLLITLLLSQNTDSCRLSKIWC